MDEIKFRNILLGFTGTNFEEPARLLLSSLDRGASLIAGRNGARSGELRGTYQLRRRRLREAGVRYPGYDQVADFFAGDPSIEWQTVLVVEQSLGPIGVIYLRQATGRPMGCWALIEVDWHRIQARKRAREEMARCA